MASLRMLHVKFFHLSKVLSSARGVACVSCRSCVMNSFNLILSSGEEFF
jgi:hypothetical protein